MAYSAWNIAPPLPHTAARLRDAGVPSLLADILSARGIDSTEDATHLLSPQAQPMYDPMLLRDMDRAVTRICTALDSGESITVFGDYDVDGITSTSLLTTYFRSLGANVTPYIPHRTQEGYGLNCDAIKTLAAQGTSLIITVDCGITAVSEIDLATELGVDVVITDHHSCKETLPNACAVVDPQRPDCPYPFKKLAGVGVALKLAMAIATARQESADEIFMRFSTLAAVGTIADVMPMVDENRMIVSHGLEQLNTNPCVGLHALIAEAGLGEKPLSTVSIGYTIAPRINASGRMGRADVAVELLLTDCPQRAQELAQELCALNRDRQAIELEILNQCIESLDAHPPVDAILLSDGTWHQGVAGIVASRLAERYNLPTFIVCLTDGIGKGSCRSWGGVNLFALLDSCRDLLEGFGGHALAAGFTVREENLPALLTHLRQNAPLMRDDRAEGLALDCTVAPETLTVDTIESLDALEPCGSGNPRPALASLGVTVHSAALVGRGRHLKLRLESRGTLLDAIWFSSTGEGLDLSSGSRIDVAFYPQVNEFRGSRTPQLQIIDVRPAQTRAQFDRTIYEKHHTGAFLSISEAQYLLPDRDEFARIWRYLKKRALTSATIDETADRITRNTTRPDGWQSPLSHTMICLDVMAERGLIAYTTRNDQLTITLSTPAEKVVLEDSPILRSLHTSIQINSQ